MRLSFSEIFDDITRLGKKIPRDNYLSKGRVPIVDQGREFIAGYSNEQQGAIIDLPVIVFGDHTRNLKYVDFPFLLGADGVKVLSIKRDDFNPKFLYYCLLATNIPNTGYNRHFKWLKEAKINCIPYNEQVDIVRILDKVEDLIEKIKQQLYKLDLLVKSKFIEMFGHIQEKVAVSQVAKVMGGFSFQSQYITDNGVRLLQISNVTLNDITWDVCNYLPESYFERYSAFSLQKNDIIMALTRPIIQSLGNVKTCIVKKSDTPSLLNQRVARIKAIDCNYVFLFYCFMTNDFTQYVIENCSGSSQPNMSTKAIEKYLIPKVDKIIQDKFATFVERLAKLKLTIKQSLEKLETLKKALMQKYFG